ncbi:MAG TPA: peptidylprolyl isomerase [Bacteroidetes bacterium]|nr:peptidylprolyl isomerase [Bacteroidota bacterium]
MKIEEQCVASVTYTLKGDDGNIIQEATSEKPFAFIHGIGQVLPAFDTELLGKTKGEKYEFSLKSEDAYGPYDPQRMEKLDRSIFAEAPPEYIQKGASLPMELNGHTIFGVIVELDDQHITMDFNHPLAGQNLHFSGEIIEVRSATDEEIAHGHVHGPGGHEH